MKNRLPAGQNGAYRSEGMDDPVTRREAELIAAAVVEGTLAGLLGTRTTGAMAHGQQLRQVIDTRVQLELARQRAKRRSIVRRLRDWWYAWRVQGQRFDPNHPAWKP